MPTALGVLRGPDGRHTTGGLVPKPASTLSDTGPTMHSPTGNSSSRSVYDVLLRDALHNNNDSNNNDDSNKCMVYVGVSST